MSGAWWKNGVLYQIYPRSFADSDGDGIGDLRGVITHLEYLAWLGVDGIWLSPVTVSPNVDWGYDVADYCNVQPEYGTLAEFDELIAAAARLGIRVLIDLVANHTSDRHPWFVDARSSRSAVRRDWYVWSDPAPAGGPPNNWVSGFGGPAWTWDETSGQFYLHNFAPEQPDLNWWNPDVRDAFDRIQRFWFDRGVAGMRLDMCNMLIKDRELRDNPPSSPEDGLVAQLLGQRWVHNSNRPEVHDVIRRWRQLTETYDPPRVLLGEAVVHDLKDLARFYGDGRDELHLALNVPFQESDFTATALREVVGLTESALPPGAWPLWSASNHDISRMATRWAGNDPAKERLALLMLLTLRGTPLLYQGDELGLPDSKLDYTDVRDPVGHMLWPDHPGRDPARTPMPWVDQPGGGFTAPGVTPWLPMGDVHANNVQAQRAEPASVLHFTRDVVTLRRSSPDLLTGSYQAVPAPDGVWAWRRGGSTTVALNLSNEPADLTPLRGTVAIATTRRHDGDAIAGHLILEPWEGVVVTDA